MARIQIQLPEKFLFTTEITVRASDLNYGNHLGHDRVLTLLQEARIAFYRNAGFKDETSFDGTIGQIISDAAVQYKSESFLGDVLTIRIGVQDISKLGFDLLYEMSNKDTRKIVALAKTGIVCFDYATRRVSAIPQKVLALITK